MIARAVVAAALALPWLTLLPVHGALGVVVHALTLIAALHGAGLVVAQLEGRPGTSPLLLVQWGAAALIGLSGLAMVIGIATLVTHSVLVFASVAVHTSWLGVQFERYAARVETGLAGPRLWLVPVALLVGLGALLLLGASGDALPRPFDDEGHLLAQLTRVLDTGTLADPIGYPRSAQLGAQLAIGAIAAGAGDGVARIIEPLALVLALGLAVSQLRAREATTALWALVLVVAAFALALAPTDPLPCWTAVGLLLALYVMLGDVAPPPALPVALTAGALLALRYELLPIAAVAVIAAWWRRRQDHYRTAMLIGGVFAVGFPFLVTRMMAWRSVPALAHAQLAAPPHTALVLRLLITAAIAAPAACILRLALPDSRALRTAATATAIGLGAIAAHLTSAGPYGLRLAWPIAIAFTITLVVELARSRASTPRGAFSPPWGDPPAQPVGAQPVGSPPPDSLRSLNLAALISALVLCVLIHEGREAPGRLRWSRRLATAATAATYLERPSDTAAPYAQLLAQVPPGANVAVWVTSPEQLDYVRHRIIDLRTPGGARLRRPRWDPRPSKLERLLAAMSTSYLLLETDNTRLQRAGRSWFYRVMCQTPRPICADDLEAIALRHPVVARRDNLSLIDLRR